MGSVTSGASWLASARLGKGEGEGEAALQGACSSVSTLVPTATGVGELARSETTRLAPTWSGEGEGWGWG
jgi:hypothetical protein